MDKTTSTNQLDKKIKKQKLGFMITLCCSLLLAALTVLRYASGVNAWWITGAACILCTVALKFSHSSWQKSINLKQSKVKK
ncbi:hypothetical protein L4D09_01710 [Photobacterium makurazakiensis]|uniref:hypothetical protein n=1 Tax=Photobacterium makurazakiensis TaxID=2910234 RepID=UPI003D0EDB80